MSLWKNIYEISPFERQDSHLRLAFFLTCASLSLAPRMYHLRLGFSLTCASLSGVTYLGLAYILPIQVGWVGWVGYTPWTCTHPANTGGLGGWGVSLGLAYIPAIRVGWVGWVGWVGGMITYLGLAYIYHTLGVA